jgi:hybrid cluster-associated redox disulfide protein
MTKKLEITADMTIAEIMDLVPQASLILADFQLGCAHCAMGSYETLREGVLGHGKDEKELAEILKQINEIAGKPRVMVDVEGIKFTEEAYDKVLEFMKLDPDKRENLALRITVFEGKGDIEYLFDLVDKKKKSEQELKISNMRVFIDKKGLKHFEDKYIDYIDSFMGAGFKVLNVERRS